MHLYKDVQYRRVCRTGLGSCNRCHSQSTAMTIQAMETNQAGTKPRFEDDAD